LLSRIFPLRGNDFCIQYSVNFFPVKFNLGLMKNSKFFTLLRSLDQDEFYTFGKYLKRLHGGEDIALSVFNYAKRLFPGFEDEEKLKIACACRKIFKEAVDANSYNRKKLLNALSDLHLWLKEFLLLEKVKNESFESRVLWMVILKERGLDPEFSRCAARLQADVGTMTKAGVPDYMKGMVSNYFFYYHLAHNKLSTDINALQDCGNDLDLFYAVCRLKVACEMANRKNQLSLEFNLEALPAVIGLSNAAFFSDHPLLQLYRNDYELIAHRQDHRYSEIETMVATNVHKIEPEELHTILSYLHNYAIAQIRQGNEAYWNMTHQLNKFGVEHGVFTKGGEMSPTQFNNMVNAACRAKDFVWVSSFIDAHQKNLRESVRSDTVLLAEAIVLFEKNKYREALQRLKEVEFTDLHYAIRSKSLIIRSYYELPDSAVDIVGLCIAFESYLKRNRKPKQVAVEATINFIRIVKMLCREKATKEDIVREIEVTTPIYFKAWLLEKAAAYKV